MSDKHPFPGRTFKPNESVPITGTYIVLGDAYTNTNTQINLKGGECFPKRSDSGGFSYYYSFFKE